MKIILLENVKGKGSKGDVIEQPNGYANFLIRGNKAKPATDDNIKNLEDERKLKEEQEQKLIEKMKEVKSFVEQNPIGIKVKVGTDGRVFGSVSTKQIVNEYNKKYGVKLDKKKLDSKVPINALGTYKINLELHKSVKAILVVNVGE